MPQFKVAKTDDIDKLNNKEFVEDKLYIYKETNKFGRLFYDFKTNPNGQPIRIEIGPLENIYKYEGDATDDFKEIAITELLKYLPNDEFSTVSIEEIKINSLVTTYKSLYNIRAIDRTNKTVSIRKIYTQHDLTWNDYYDE